MKVRLSEDAGLEARRLGTELEAEFFYDDIIARLRGLCKGYTPAIVHRLIKDDKPPPILDTYAGKAGKRKDYFRQFSAERVFEWLVDARPDLARAIIATGDEGAVWWHKWLEAFKKKAKGEIVDVAPKSHLAQVDCSICGRSIVINKEDTDNLKVCPFCGSSREGEDTDAVAEGS